MVTARIAIVGGGLGGLYAASLLEQKGIEDYVLIEARDTFGGRIESVPAAAPQVSGAEALPLERNRFDLGATWFWPGYQPQLDRLIHRLALKRVEQYESGDMMVECSPNEPPTRMPGYISSPASMRLAGGMSSLVDALRGGLDSTRLLKGQQVRRMHCTGHGVELEASDAQGALASCRVAHVLLATPPRLAAATIDFEPPLPDALARQWRATATWMAPHAKYLAIYDKPFWREHGLSGEARSARGPLAEVHDACEPGGEALFGFLGVPARTRRNLSEDELRTHCRAQLVRLFGPEAAMPRAEFVKDWAREPHTATAADQDGASQHASAPPSEVGTGVWSGRIVGIASEWSQQFPGYVAGAVEAADSGVRALLPTTPWAAPHQPWPSDLPSAP